MAIDTEQPPLDTHPDLSAFLMRKFTGINIALGRSNYFPPRTILPNKVRVGELYYFGAAIPATPISGEGLWLYKSTGWVLVA